MWYVADGNDMLIVTGAGSQKRHNMDRDPRVGVVVDRRRRPYYALMIEGRAEPDETAVAELRARIASRYLPTKDVAAYLESRRDRPTVAFRIVPGKVLEYGAPPIS